MKGSFPWGYSVQVSGLQKALDPDTKLDPWQGQITTDLHNVAASDFRSTSCFHVVQKQEQISTPFLEGNLTCARKALKDTYLMKQLILQICTMSTQPQMQASFTFRYFYCCEIDAYWGKLSPTMWNSWRSVPGTIWQSAQAYGYLLRIMLLNM